MIVFLGPAYLINSEDGPCAVCDYNIGITVGGKDYAFNAPFRSDYAAREMIERLRGKPLDLECEWTEVTPYDREAEAARDWQDEQEDRRAWGA